MSSEVVLRAEHLTKVYRVYSRPHHRVLQAFDDRSGRGARHCFEVPAVSDVSFELRRGEGLSIIGRNGSGKSTLLEMVVGTLQPTAGGVHRVGRASALLELGAGFNPDFTGRQNLRMSAAIQGLSEAEIKAIEPEVEAFAEIGPFIDEPVRTYSSGMYVRLAFAAAVHVFPDLLVVDEALAVGDIFFQQKCYDFIDKRLMGAAKLIVTHDLASAVRLSNRCLVMDGGQVVFDGEPLEAVEVYTALNLRERSTRTGSLVARPIATSESPGGEDSTPDLDDDVEMDAGAVVIPAGRASAPELMRVERAWVRRSDAATGDVALDAAAAIVTPGEHITLSFEVVLGLDIERPVWGYLVRDRVGNALFGQNTLGSDIRTTPLEAGSYVVELELEWPEVEQGDYSLTVGLGSGHHPLHHDIIGWVQSVLRLVCVPRRPVHGAFNNDLRSVRVEVRQGSRSGVRLDSLRAERS